MTLSKVINIEKSYSFQLYSYTPLGVTPVLFYPESSKELSMVHKVYIPPTACFLVAIIASISLASKIGRNGKCCKLQSQRILRQLGFDQGVGWIVWDSSFSSF